MTRWLLTARFKRWFHCFTHLHRGVTFSVSNIPMFIGCECGYTSFGNRETSDAVMKFLRDGTVSADPEAAMTKKKGFTANPELWGESIDDYANASHRAARRLRSAGKGAMVRLSAYATKNNITIRPSAKSMGVIEGFGDHVWTVLVRPLTYKHARAYHVRFWEPSLREATMTTERLLPKDDPDNWLRCDGCGGLYARSVHKPGNPCPSSTCRYNNDGYLQTFEKPVEPSRPAAPSGLMRYPNRTDVGGDIYRAADVDVELARKDAQIDQANFDLRDYEQTAKQLVEQSAENQRLRERVGDLRAYCERQSKRNANGEQGKTIFDEIARKLVVLVRPGERT